MAAETVVLKVAMSCEGCAGAVRRVLSKMEGIETFDIDLKEQKVTVKGNVKPEDVFQTVSKSGKKTSYWEGKATAPDASAPAAAEAAPNTAAEAPADAAAAAAAVPEITPAKADT
ncbi:copper transport protein ATX1-like isoform X2 [Miscanthus floridulus]|uniref:copper transport protein ATX1-like isoform X2 n=1 Tax=Miscanthus floridulus TaxID=154761 RepID=UPI003458DDE8